MGSPLPEPRKPAFFGGMNRKATKNIARTVISCLAIAASLATFPAAVPLMVAAWLLLASWLAWRDRPAWIPLAVCLAILLIKRVAWLPGLILYMGAMSLTIVIGIWIARAPTSKHASRAVLSSLVVLWLCWALLQWDWHASSTASGTRVLDLNRPVVCIGNSLTSGIAPDPGYPEHLAKLLNVPVINLGRAGISTTEGVKLIPPMLSSRPQVVIIELGGHDFLKGRSREATRDNLLQIIRAVREIGAEPILMEVPRGFMLDPFAGLERELARQEDLELISDTVIRRLVLWSPYAPPGMWTGGPYLSDDGLHPNSAGNEELAKASLRALRNIYGDAVNR